MASVFIPRESRPGETRVAVSPETVKRFVKKGLTVRVQTGAGERAGFPDKMFEDEGAAIAPGDGWEEADLVLKVQPPTTDELGSLRKGSTLISYAQASLHQDEVRGLVSGDVTTLAMELVPRITRAQSMDALSSQATVAGYKAVLLGASAPAGAVPPADDRRRDRPAGQGGGLRGRRRGPDGDRHGAPPGLRRRGHGRADGGQGAGGEPRRASFIDVPGMPRTWRTPAATPRSSPKTS